MDESSEACRFEQLTDLDGPEPTLIEGLPGLGMVASIAVDQITRQLGLEHHGNLHADAFPPVATFEDGQIVDSVRVYAGRDPDVMTLQSAMPIPPAAYAALSRCVLDLADAYRRAVFLVGAPAASEDEIGEVVGVATTETQRKELEKAGIEQAAGKGVIGGPTGAIVRACYRVDVPAVALVTKTHPKLPDPGAARAVIENAVEPLVDFDIDTTELKERDEEIQRQMEEVAQEFQKMQQGGGGQGSASPPSEMYR